MQEDVQIIYYLYREKISPVLSWNLKTQGPSKLDYIKCFHCIAIPPCVFNVYETMHPHMWNMNLKNTKWKMRKTYIDVLCL